MLKINPNNTTLPLTDEEEQEAVKLIDCYWRGYDPPIEVSNKHLEKIQAFIDNYYRMSENDKVSTERTNNYEDKTERLILRNAELEKEIQGMKEQEGYDFTNAREDEKELIVNGFIELTGKHAMQLFYALGLKTHITAEVINELTKEVFEFRFHKKPLTDLEYLQYVESHPPLPKSK